MVGLFLYIIIVYSYRITLCCIIEVVGVAFSPGDGLNTPPLNFDLSGLRDLASA